MKAFAQITGLVLLMSSMLSLMLGFTVQWVGCGVILNVLNINIEFNLKIFLGTELICIGIYFILTAIYGILEISTNNQEITNKDIDEHLVDPEVHS